MRRTSSPMRAKLTILLRLPHGLLLIAGLLAYSPVAWSQISLVQVAPPVPAAYQDLYSALSTQVASFDAVVSESVFSLVLERY